MSGNSDLSPPTYPIPVSEPGHVDPPPRPNWQGAVIKDRSVWFRCDCGPFKLKLNPIVTICSVLVIIAFILWCVLEPKHALDSFNSAKTWITETFTWFYIGSQDIWAVVIIAIYFSKYGAMKMGQDDEKPEYNDATWFAMLYACGIGVGLFFFGVAEPMWHYLGPNRYTRDKYMTDNEVAQWAINLTLFHWGIHGWVVYAMVAIILGFLSFRKGMPMTMKSCFYPLIGDRIYGWIGDLIDVFSILTTLFGVCTSLGLGTMQVNKGLNYLNEDIAVSTNNQVIIIWAITAVATTSVVTGIGVGIRRLSEICFSLGMVIMLMVVFLEDTWYLLNLFCQSVGFYFQWLMQLGFHCDAFELSVKSYGAVDRGRAFTDGEGDGPANWMDGWTIFYWGWWISWSPFVGMFIAKISRGRTIRQFINGAMTAPITYSFMWLCIFGGAGIKTERTAAGAGLCCHTWDHGVLAWNETQFAAGSADWTVSQSGLKLCKGPEKDSVACEGDGHACSWGLMDAYIKSHPSGNPTSRDVFDYINSNIRWLGKYPSNDDRSKARLSCMASEEMWFANIATYGDMGPFLCIISLVALILYFVTSSDSGSLVIDIMSANGDEDPPVTQRVFWALVEGATATALLVAGGEDSLKALQTASVAAGLPYTIILCFVCIATWRALAMETGDLNPYGPDFAVSLVDPFSTMRPNLWLGVLKNILLTPLTLYNVLKKHNIGAVGISVGAGIAWVAWIALIILEIIYLEHPTIKLKGIYSLAWVFYLGFASLVTVARAKIRDHYGINGNPIEDFFAAMLVYPAVMVQLETVSEKNGLAPMMPDSGSEDNHLEMDIINNKGNGAAMA